MCKGLRPERLHHGAEYDEPYLASLIPGRVVKTFSRHTLRKRFGTSCRVLGAARLEALAIHHGRHTFISHALAGGRTLAEVRDAAGHANVSITSGYLYVAVEAGSTIRSGTGRSATPTTRSANTGTPTIMAYEEALSRCNTEQAPWSNGFAILRSHKSLGNSSSGLISAHRGRRSTLSPFNRSIRRPPTRPEVSRNERRSYATH